MLDGNKKLLLQEFEDDPRVSPEQLACAREILEDMEVAHQRALNELREIQEEFEKKRIRRERLFLMAEVTLPISFELFPDGISA